jgi:hypothetical protein
MIHEIESRQDEVLRQLKELEERVVKALSQMIDPRFINIAEPSRPESQVLPAKAA